MNDKLYSNYLSTHPFYSSKIQDIEGSYRLFRANVLKFLPKNKHASILDVGCGTGHFLSFLKEQGYKNYLGVDISKEQIDYCKKHITKNVHLIQDLKNFLKNKKDSFDFVIMNDVVEHLEKADIVDAISLIRNCLREKGKFLTRTVNLKNRWGMAVRYMDFTHTVGFTEESIRQVMLASGFQIVLINKEIHPIHDIKSFLRVALKSLFELFYRLEYIASFGGFNPNLSNMLIVVGEKLKERNR